MISKGKFEFQYGRVEIRAKLPQGQGTWPALWLLGGNIDQVGWPRCGEIYIMEHGDGPNGLVSSQFIYLMQMEIIILFAVNKE